MHVGNPEPSPVAGEGVETLREALVPTSEEKVQTTNAQAASKDEVGDIRTLTSLLRNCDDSSELSVNKAVVELYESGLSALKIADRLGLGTTTVYRHLKRAGISPKDRLKSRRRGKPGLFTAEQEREIAGRYINERLSLLQLAVLYGCNHVTIRNALLRRGVTLAPKGNRYREFSPDEISEMRRLYESGMAQSAIADRCGSHQTIISRVLRANGVEARSRPAIGSRHGNWRGGAISVAGYRYVHLPVGHPFRSMAHRGGYVAEHRLRLAEKLGRPLEPHETVHHINGDKLDNRTENLELRTGRHGRGAACYCADCGSRHLVFDELETAPAERPN
jgi:DNA invertase Pin-like site-specific DNA recombinase